MFHRGFLAGSLISFICALSIAGCGPSHHSGGSPPPPPPTIGALSVSALPNGALNQPYAGGLTANGGTAPYQYGATGLPPGLSLDPLSGKVTGSPTQAGSFNVISYATDHTGATANSPFTMTITP